MNTSGKYEKWTTTTLGRDQRGATGLETAIILIAFAVVASVFSFTVLSWGIFSSGRGRQITQAGPRGATNPLVLAGPVTANSIADKTPGRHLATSLVVTLAIAPQGNPVDLTTPVDADQDAISGPERSHSLVITYTAPHQVVRDVHWTQAFIGANDGDDLLETEEKVQLTITLQGLKKANPLVWGTEFQLELRVGDGDALVIERTMPDTIDAIMNLN